MSIINAIALSAAGDDGYRIERSLRFNSPDSAYLNRTPASATNRRTWTWSGWLKRTSLGGIYGLFSAKQTKDDTTYFGFDSLNRLGFLDRPATVTNAQLITQQVFRDTSAWYHIMVVVDTPNATAGDRLRFYVNGVRTTQHDATTYPSQNYEIAYINNTVDHRIGTYQDNAQNYLAGYLTEINFIDGQALTPSSFGETNPVTGVWGPKRYAGTYGTNGFYLKFADNSNTTAATLGKDSSGNGNNWTPNNFSVTAGISNDSFIDTPTPYVDGGNGRGNYPTWNPLNAVQSQLLEGNLWSVATGSSTNVVTTFPTPITGKWYAELTLGLSPNINWPMVMGVSDGIGGNTYCRLYTDWSAFAIFKSLNGTTSSVTPSGSFPANGDILKIAYDAGNGRIWLGLNAGWYGTSGSLTGNPSSGTDPTLSGASAKEMYPNHSNAGGPAQQAYLNCGQRPFAYTPPTEFLALNTQNLPEPSIKNTLTVFDATTWTGTGASLAVNVTGKFQPDLVWIKGRSGATGHRLTDSVRGVTNALSSDSPSSNTIVDTQGVTAFNSGGFTVGSNATYNTSSATYIAWQWKRGASQGFDISSTFTGTGSAQTVTHSLGVAPSMIILFSTGGTNWINPRVYHTRLSAGNALQLSTTVAQFSEPATFASVNSSSFQTTQTSGQINVAYLFSEVAGFSKFGSYTGNGSADGPFVYCGFRPRWVMVKSSSNITNWYVFDTARNEYNLANKSLFPNLSNAENTGGNEELDIVSNGFKMRNASSSFNISGYTYIFAAFAESPQKYSLAR